MKKIAIIAAICALLAACSDGPNARRHLADMGFKDIRITGYRWFGCSDSDSFSTGFVATAPNGRQVSGIVCSGWMKGATIRLD